MFKRAGILAVVAAAALTSSAKAADIVDTAAAAGSFNTLVAAVEACAWWEPTSDRTNEMPKPRL